MDAWNNRNFAATRGKDEFNHSHSLSDTKNPSGYQDRTAVPRIRREQCDACRIRGHEVRFCVMLVNTGIYRLAFCQCDKSRLYGPMFTLHKSRLAMLAITNGWTRGKSLKLPIYGLSVDPSSPYDQARRRRQFRSILESRPCRSAIPGGLQLDRSWPVVQVNADVTICL